MLSQICIIYKDEEEKVNQLNENDEGPETTLFVCLCVWCCVPGICTLEASTPTTEL